MSFLNLGAFVFAATIPVVILFYLLKRKRVVRRVSSTLLWQKFLAETQANAPFQKLRRNWLLILQLIMLVLAILALARPYFSGRAKPAKMEVVLIDASASMKSIDVKPTRFEAAKTEALARVDGLRDEDLMVVLQAGGHTKVKQSATGEKAALRRAIRSCEAEDAPTRLRDALKLAETLIRGRHDAEIHVFSDGAVDDLSDLARLQLPVVFHRVGQRGDNAGIVAMDVRANPDNQTQKAIYAAILNHSDHSRSIPIDLSFDGSSVDGKVVEVGANETVPVVFVATPDHDGVFTLRLKTEDDLDVDNQASAVSVLPRPAKVLLVSRGNRFLEKALHAANVELSTAPNLANPASDYDIVVLDDVTPAVWPETSVLGFHIFNTNWMTGWSRMESPAIVDWKGTHPLLRYVNFDNVQVAEAWKVDPPVWAAPLVEAQKGPLVLGGEYQRQRIVWVAFDSLQSTWPLRISFPIFVANAMDWLNPSDIKSGERRVKAGETFRMALKEPAPSAEITLPDHSRRTVKLDPAAHELVFGDTTECGIYRVSIGTNQLAFCVNLLDADESKTKPREEMKIGKFGTIEATMSQPANLELWRWVTAAALAILMYEWWYYHKRTV